MTDTELELFIVMDVTSALFFPNFLLAVERLVKLVTKASKAVSGPKSRDGFIRAQIASRQLMSRFESKSYCTLLTLICNSISRGAILC